MRIVTRILDTKERQPTKGRPEDEFLALEIQNEIAGVSKLTEQILGFLNLKHIGVQQKLPDFSNAILEHKGHAYNITPRIAEWVYWLLDYYNGNNQHRKEERIFLYPEDYVSCFEREYLWDCHNFAFSLATASINFRNGMLKEEDMNLAGYEVMMRVTWINKIADGNVTVDIMESNDQSGRKIIIQELESLLIVGTIITLSCRWTGCHSFLYIGKTEDWEGMYIQRLGRGWHIVITTFEQSCHYYQYMNERMNEYDSCIYIPTENMS